MSRNLEKAVPYLRTFVPLLIEAVRDRLGINIFIVDVDRDYKVQIAYYAQGRESVETTNRLRRIVGLPTITTKMNRKKITWTMNSKHITNLEDDESFNDLSRAVDIGIKDDNGRYRGESQTDLNADGKHDYEQIGAIIEELGEGKIKWGGRFGDEPHFEVV